MADKVTPVCDLLVNQRMIAWVLYQCQPVERVFMDWFFTGLRGRPENQKDLEDNVHLVILLRVNPCIFTKMSIVFHVESEAD